MKTPYHESMECRIIKRMSLDGDHHNIKGKPLSYPLSLFLRITLVNTQRGKVYIYIYILSNPIYCRYHSPSEKYPKRIYKLSGITEKKRNM